MAPNFKSLIEQARSVANPHVAVAEFTDNSMDAGATKIKITSSVSRSNMFDLYISDNGCGMDYNQLNAAVKMGSSQKEEDSDKLFGCKGVGMNISATYLADDAFEIYTKSETCKTINVATINIKKMNENPLNNDWDSLYNFNQVSINEIEDTIITNFLDSVSSGTVVILRNMSRDRNGIKNKFDKLITTDDRGLSRIYRHILQDRKLEIFYNSSIIQSTGPGFDLKTKHQDKVFFQNTRGNKDGWITDTVSPFGTASYDYRFRFVRVATNNSKGTSGQTGGLSIMRNGREVTSQLIAHIRPKTFGLGNLIIELDAPSAFLDKVLTFNGDKQIRTLENATENFDFRGWIKNRVLNKYWDFIIEINAEDAIDDGNEQEKAKAWNYSESLLVDRYYEMQKESLRSTLSDDEIENVLLKEYQVPGTSFRVDLIQQGLPFEFKVNGDDPSKVVGQILSYAPYLVKDDRFEFVKNNVLRFKLALGKKPSNSLKRHVEAINSSYKIGDVSLKIEIFDMTERTPKLLDYPCSRKEKNKLKDIA